MTTSHHWNSGVIRQRYVHFINNGYGVDRVMTRGLDKLPRTYRKRGLVYTLEYCFIQEKYYYWHETGKLIK